MASSLSSQDSHSAPGEITGASGSISLGKVRDELIRMEDTIIFCLIERARLPYNSPAYDPSYCGGGQPLVEVFVREAEALQAKLVDYIFLLKQSSPASGSRKVRRDKDLGEGSYTFLVEAGRYLNPEEVPFFPDDLPLPLVPPYNYPLVLHPAAASANATKEIWDMYFNDLLPLITVKGDDGNYASTVSLDLVCLQALCRRIHYGKYVAEVKYRETPQDYGIAIHNQDRDTLMKMLTFEIVEDMVKRRVKKKTAVFGQNVTLDSKHDIDENADYTIDPSVISRLYCDWVIPLTKFVEVEYLLRRIA